MLCNGVQALPPYSLLVLQAFTKPLIMLIIFGFGSATIKHARDQTYIPGALGPALIMKYFMKKPAQALTYFLMVTALVSDFMSIAPIIWEKGLDAKLTFFLMKLSTSGNVAATFCALSLYAIANGDIGSKDAYWPRIIVPDVRALCLSVYADENEGFVKGRFGTAICLAPIDRSALKRFDPIVDFYIQFLIRTYRTVLYAMFWFCLPAVVVYCWVTGLVLVFAALVKCATQVVMVAALKFRIRYFSSEEELKDIKERFAKDPVDMYALCVPGGEEQARGMDQDYVKNMVGEAVNLELMPSDKDYLRAEILRQVDQLPNAWAKLVRITEKDVDQWSRYLLYPVVGSLCCAVFVPLAMNFYNQIFYYGGSHQSFFSSYTIALHDTLSARDAHMYFSCALSIAEGEGSNMFEKATNAVNMVWLFF